MGTIIIIFSLRWHYPDQVLRSVAVIHPLSPVLRAPVKTTMPCRRIFSKMHSPVHDGNFKRIAKSESRRGQEIRIRSPTRMRQYGAPRWPYDKQNSMTAVPRMWCAAKPIPWAREKETQSAAVQKKYDKGIHTTARARAAFAAGWTWHRKPRLCYKFWEASNGQR